VTFDTVDIILYRWISKNQLLLSLFPFFGLLTEGGQLVLAQTLPAAKLGSPFPAFIFPFFRLSLQE